MCNFFQTRSFSLRGLFAFAIDLLGGGLRIINKEETEEEIAKQMSNGDNHAFGVLYERYFDQIFRFTMKRVGMHETTEDLVSTIFMKVFTSRHRFTSGSFKAWVYRIANNTIIDHYRTRKTTIVLDPEKHAISDQTQSSSDALDQRTLRQTIETVLSKLDTRSQIVLQLKFFGELSNEEIAVTLKISTNHVGVLVYRALQKCSKFFPENIKL